jgi:hypothetical protein
MKYNVMLSYDELKFRRISGVKPETFAKMVEILHKALEAKHQRRGRKPKLSVEDMLLASLEYWREYRTYAHIAASFGIHESNIYRIIKWVEEVLIKDGTFSLPGKSALANLDDQYEIVLIDATETPIERPKKDNADGTAERKNATP